MTRNRSQDVPSPRLQFDFADRYGRVRSQIFSAPVRLIVASTLPEIEPAMQAAQDALGQGFAVAGFVTYEAATAFDPALATRTDNDLPLLWFGVFNQPTESPDEGDLPAAAVVSPAPTWVADTSADAFAVGVRTIREAIAAGDSYQTNYTFRLHATIDTSDVPAMYKRLRADQRPKYAALLELGHKTIVSLSPELFFRVDHGQVTSQPMKGTAPRGLWSEDDRRRAAALAASEKNRAENVMIVDLTRNDLGRIAEVGSVRVTSMFEIERYPSVLQMVSSVEATLLPDVGLRDIFAALFPAGSITGAPKTSSMRLIYEVESSPRGVYCGAIGFAMPDGTMAFNVAIRTAVIDTTSRNAVYGVGGGITWDSDIADEHAEALSKASFLTPQPHFDLIETLRLENGTYVRGARHLRRLAASADYFGFNWDEGIVRDALAAFSTRHPAGVLRVRLLLGRHGGVTISCGSLEPPSSTPRPVTLATLPVPRADRFLHHKTSHRAVYDTRRREHPDAFDVLLWNESAELTEFTIGNLVMELDGRRFTPPQACGLLAGVFRESLLDEGIIHERVLSMSDLGRASRLWLINSLREWVEVRCDPEPRSAPQSTADVPSRE